VPGTHGLQDPLVDNDNSQVEVKISGPTDDIKKSLTKENNAHTNMDDSYNNSSDKKSQRIVQEIAD
jgi:zinc transporter 1/2/3